jgi:hypothetical protein
MDNLPKIEKITGISGCSPWIAKKLRLCYTKKTNWTEGEFREVRNQDFPL